MIHVRFFDLREKIAFLDLIALALHRDIKFMFERPQQINVDAIFGMNLADGKKIFLFFILLSHWGRYVYEKMKKWKNEKMDVGVCAFGFQIF